ncbi:MAG: hypothetical protein ACJA13_000561 [Paraglaciecola sp.]|jgi:hypothetical protein
MSNRLNKYLELELCHKYGCQWELATTIESGGSSYRQVCGMAGSI